MNKDQLHYFALVYEQGSYTLAAKLIPLTPQAVNKSIKSLERELGRKLFSEDAFKPTPYADALYECVCDFKARYDALMASYAQIDSLCERVLRIGLATGVLDILGASFFDRFKQAYDDIDFEIEEVNDLRCDENLLAGMYNLAFTVAPYHEELETIEIISMPLAMWVNRQSPLSLKESIKIEDLAEHKLATPIPGAKNTQRIFQLCEDRGVIPKRIVNLQQMYRIYEFVLHGKGIGTNVGILLESELFKREQVVSLPFEDFVFSFGISWQKDRSLSPMEQLFVEYTLRMKDRFPLD